MGSTLSDREVQLGLKNVIRDGLTTQIMVSLTGSVFLVAFAVALGASNFVIGLLATIPLLANLVQIPMIYVIERYRKRRRITMIGAGMSRSFLLLTGLVPFLFPLGLAVPIMVVTITLASLLGSMAGTAWNSWIHDLLPHNSLGRFFSRRMLLAAIVGIPLSLAAGLFLDYWKATYPTWSLLGYSLLYVWGCTAGFVGVYVISCIPEPELERRERMPHYKELLREPFEDTNFRNLIVFLTSWSFAINLALPFFTVYMLRTLGLEMTSVVLLTVVAQVTSVLFFEVWGKLSDQYSNKSVLRVSGPIYLVAIAAWTLTTLPIAKFALLPILAIIHILLGMAQAGVNLTTGNIGIKLAPKGDATCYLASSSFFSNMAAGLAPVLGGILAFILPWEAFFIGAFCVGMVSIRWLATVKEDGDVGDKVIVKELVEEMKHEVITSVEMVEEEVKKIPHPHLKAELDRQADSSPPS